MSRRRVLVVAAVLGAALVLAGCAGNQSLLESRRQQAEREKEALTALAPGGKEVEGCKVRAVNLIGAWVDAGAPDGEFEFQSEDGQTCVGNFQDDILPAFTTDDYWYKGSQKCTACHTATSEESVREMGLATYEGIIKGADCVTGDCVKIVIPGDWQNSPLRARLRNNRMPPGMPFDITEANRDGPVVEAGGGDVHAVDLIGAWVDAGAPDGEFEFEDVDGKVRKGSFAKDILPAFTKDNYWYEGSQKCTTCHTATSEESVHEMGLGTYEGIMTGGDCVTGDCVKIVIPGDWQNSPLRARLRNNRMPPGMPFDITEANRDGPTVEAGRPK